MRCREIEDNPDIDYVKRYCISLLRNNAKRDAKREKIAAQQAMNIAQEQAEKAEIASYAAKRDSIRSIQKNKEADIAKSQAIKALKQAKNARRDAQ